jgi:hypothetical protein
MLPASQQAKRESKLPFIDYCHHMLPSYAPMDCILMLPATQQRQGKQQVDESMWALRANAAASKLASFPNHSAFHADAAVRVETD